MTTSKAAILYLKGMALCTYTTSDAMVHDAIRVGLRSFWFTIMPLNLQVSSCYDLSSV